MQTRRLPLLAAATLAVLLSAATPPIQDPEAFVRGVYSRFVESSKTRHDYNPPEDIYTPRLKALIDRDTRLAKGEVGCLDFVFWVNGQDWSLTDVRVKSRAVEGHPDRRTVTATFVNDTPQEIEFDFQRTARGWLLDEVRSRRDIPWTLSEILHCRER